MLTNKMKQGSPNGDVCPNGQTTSPRVRGVKRVPSPHDAKGKMSHRENSKQLLEDRNHNIICMRAMNNLRKSGHLCDFYIQAGDREIPAHRIILCSSSIYFANLLSAKQQDTEITRCRVDLDGEVVDHLVEFSYTGSIELGVAQVQNVLVAAHQLQFITVRHACIEFLKRHMSALTCIAMRQFSKTINCGELIEAADLFTLQHFHEVAQTEEFFKLPYTQVWELISSDNLCVNSEDIVFEAVMGWVKYDIQFRRSYLEGLFSAIRLPLIPTRYLLNKVETEELITSDVKCNNLLHQAKNYHLLPDGRSRFAIPGPISNPNRSRLVNSVLYAVGGEELHGERLKSVECFSPETGEWIPVASLNTERSGAAVTFLQGYLYACGGFERNCALSSVERYDIYNNRWSFMPPMNTERSCAGATVIDNALYVVGGNSNSKGIRSVERFDPRCNAWSTVSQMQFPRNGVAVTTCRGMIYAIGGHDGDQELKSAERYNTRTNSWESICSMFDHRSYSVAGVVSGEILVAGGFNGQVNLSTVEKYDTTKDAWTMLSMLGTPRSYAGCGILNNQMFIVGGCDSSSCLSTVEMYDVTANKFKPVQNMRKPRACSGVAGLYFNS